jgi:hypothetical protein
MFISQAITPGILISYHHLQYFKYLTLLSQRYRISRTPAVNRLAKLGKSLKPLSPNHRDNKHHAVLHRKLLTDLLVNYPLEGPVYLLQHPHPLMFSAYPVR